MSNEIQKPCVTINYTYNYKNRYFQWPFVSVSQQEESHLSVALAML